MQDQIHSSKFNLINQNAMRQSKSDANLINSQLQQRGTLSNKKRNDKQAAKKKSAFSKN